MEILLPLKAELLLERDKVDYSQGRLLLAYLFLNYTKVQNYCFCCIKVYYYKKIMQLQE